VALLGNYSVLHKGPGRAFSGNVAAGDRANWSKPGARRGWYTHGVPQEAGIPNAVRPPHSLVIPQRGGYIASRNLIVGRGAITAPLIGGRNGAATMQGVGSISALGQLIASASATLSGSGTITNAGMLAVLNASATLAGSGNITGAMGALGSMAAIMEGEGTLLGDVSALGHMSAEITPFTELSPQSLAAAVWASPEGRFLYALGRNKVVTDPAAGTYTVYDDDGVTVLYVADLWENAAGTTPYSGSGAERRDRLEG